MSFGFRRSITPVVFRSLTEQKTLRNQGGCVVEIGEHLSVLYYGRSSVQDSSYGQVTQSHHSAPFEQRPAFFELAEVAVSKGYRYRPKRPGAGGYLRLC